MSTQACAKKVMAEIIAAAKSSEQDSRGPVNQIREAEPEYRSPEGHYWDLRGNQGHIFITLSGDVDGAITGAAAHTSNYSED